MKPRYARAIRAGIQAARTGNVPVMFANDLMARAYLQERKRVFKRGLVRDARIIWGNAASRTLRAAETFAHTQTPGHATRAGNLNAAPMEGQA